MQMAQIPQGGPVFVAHPACERRIIQVSVASRFRHVLQHTQALLNSLLPLLRQIPPRRQYVVLDMVALLRRHLLPHPSAFPHVLLLLRRQLAEALLILDHSLAIFGAQAILLLAESPIVYSAVRSSRRVLALWRPVGIHTSTIEILPLRILSVKVSPARIRAIVITPVDVVIETIRASWRAVCTGVPLLPGRRTLGARSRNTRCRPRLWSRSGRAMILPLRQGHTRKAGAEY